jgi:prevent-host-death family protein
MKVNVRAAQRHFAQLIFCAQSGETIVITYRDKPIARLVSIHPGDARESRRGQARDFVAWLKANPLPAHLQRSHEDIDSGIQTERESWD